MTVTLLDPTLGAPSTDAHVAERATSLDGAVLGLVNNGKTHGREILLRVAENLGERYEIADTILMNKPNASAPATDAAVAELAAGATAIIAAIGD